jgi:hypothetical protein
MRTQYVDGHGPVTAGSPEGRLDKDCEADVEVREVEGHRARLKVSKGAEERIPLQHG